MTTIDLLRKQPSPAERESHGRLFGNHGRRTGCEPLVRAVRMAATKTPALPLSGRNRRAK